MQKGKKKISFDQPTKIMHIFLKRVIEHNLQKKYKNYPNK